MNFLRLPPTVRSGALKKMSPQALVSLSSLSLEVKQLVPTLRIPFELDIDIDQCFVRSSITISKGDQKCNIDINEAKDILTLFPAAPVETITISITHSMRSDHCRTFATTVDNYLQLMVNPRRELSCANLTFDLSEETASFDSRQLRNTLSRLQIRQVLVLHYIPSSITFKFMNLPSIIMIEFSTGINARYIKQVFAGSGVKMLILNENPMNPTEFLTLIKYWARGQLGGIIWIRVLSTWIFNPLLFVDILEMLYEVHCQLPEVTIRTPTGRTARLEITEGTFHLFAP